MGQRKTLRQILEILPELVRDVEACEESLNDANDKQHLRRSYVRALFTMIEGTVHSIKELEFAELNSREKLHIPTLVALKESVFEVDRLPLRPASKLRQLGKQYLASRGQCQALESAQESLKNQSFATILRDQL